MKRWTGNLAGLVIFAAFCALAVWIWVPAPDVDARDPSPAPQGVEATIAQRAEPLADLIDVTGARPLFHASRRPPAVEVAVATPAPQAPEPSLTLVGVIVSDGTKVALVRISTSPELYRVDVGAQLAAWKVVGIGDDFIQVSKSGGAPIVLSMDER